MLRGLDYAVPAIFVSVCTIGLGGLFLIVAWCVAISDNSKEIGLYRYPSALYIYTASVFSDLLGMFVLSVMPDEWEQYYILGTRLRLCIYTIFMLISFVLVFVSLILLRRRNGRVRGVLMIGSIVLLAVNVLGLVLYISMHGNP